MEAAIRVQRLKDHSGAFELNTHTGARMHTYQFSVVLFVVLHGNRPSVVSL
jgi:hypothetical protein